MSSRAVFRPSSSTAAVDSTGAPTHALLAAGLRACRSALLASFAFLISASDFSSFRFASIGCSFSPSALDSKETTERSVKRASAVAAAGATEASGGGGGTACPAGTTGSSIRPNISSGRAAAASATGRAAGLRFMLRACGSHTEWAREEVSCAHDVASSPAGEEIFAKKKAQNKRKRGRNRAALHRGLSPQGWRTTTSSRA